MQQYEFREVKCPWCDHTFMWNKTEGGLRLNLYIYRPTSEVLSEAICPDCGSAMLVAEHVLTGIDMDNASLVYKVDDKCEWVHD